LSLAVRLASPAPPRLVAIGGRSGSGKSTLAAALAPLVHMPTWLRVAAERTVSRAMGGSCSMPLAAYAQWQQQAPGVLDMEAAWGDPEGRSPVLRVRQQARVGSLAEAEALGASVAADLKSAGAVAPPPGG
ncbi:MAG: hydroxymethylbilane synthase, partial [Burkholderiales bacterium]